MYPQKEKILITVKTYPTLSVKYWETVCTAGLREDGSWIRLYPIAFRMLDYGKRYKKYQWVEVDVARNSNDFRPESFRPNLDTLRPIPGVLSTKQTWAARKEIVFKSKIYKSMKELITDAKDKDKLISLATFKPADKLEVIIRPNKDDQDEKKIKSLKDRLKQQDIFNDKPEDVIGMATKIPYDFCYQFQDVDGATSTLKIIDWEIGQLYLNCLKGSTPELACEKVKAKYTNLAEKHDIYIFLGTTKEFHLRGPNPFTIVGVFYPKAEKSRQLFTL